MSFWWKKLLQGNVEVKAQLTPSELSLEALELKMARRTPALALVTTTGKHTGRAADDKYVVEGEFAENKIDWDNNVRRLSRNDFDEIRNIVLKDLSNHKCLYTEERSACANTEFSLGVRLLTTNPLHALFVCHMFREKTPMPPLGEFTIIHHPEYQIENKKFNLRSSTAIMIDFAQKEVVIIGTSYAGEIKKAIFSVLNTILPDQGLFPMHTGCNVTNEGKSSLFFGLSGTGKTTLSSDEGTYLIGDDEHVLFDGGIFNIEGGCYAKTLGLSEATEPQIFQAVSTKDALLENVVIDATTNQPDFKDKSLTENGRASYPISYISDALLSGVCAPPSNVFFLSADAFGVLPPVSKLSESQALYYFLSGYTAKVAGTEVGLKQVKAAFSHCFGAPFMMRKPEVYAELFLHYMKTQKFNVWLINTGWYGGVYGKGKRYELSLTRTIIRAIQKGVLDNTVITTEPYFALKVPSKILGIPDERLLPVNSWNSEAEYAEQASVLAKLMDENFARISGKMSLQSGGNHQFSNLIISREK